MKTRGKQISRLCVEIAILWQSKAPELRFMQLINNFQTYKGSDCFYMTDERFLKELTEYLNKITRKG